ncbi:hypothetical protein C1I98_28555 [Spongiactinospora gelatinilytica]|uniref:Exonuclease domain-containing protein n=1 Tax=Spongiactinospora gelatinilytica TaxID=2666298 RepID=A0A2W2FDJ8_9ACTN|nr:hypothetical protein [Spongiactinospora gelatinilytica]PZG33712.1 hypothetical protein C1I98_28555 [Spongiactinospora gelatinilytica]
MTKIVFLDTETTSLDDERGEVWEIAAILRRPGAADAEHLWQIRPTLTTADPMSLKISRYYERRLLDIHAPGEAVELASPYLNELERRGEETPPALIGAARVACKLAELLAGAHVVGAVPDFDFRFLRRFLRTHGECWTAHYHLIDVEALAVGYLEGVAGGSGIDERRGVTVPPWKSVELYRVVGVNPDGYEAHTALGDARLVRDVYDAVMSAP